MRVPEMYKEHVLSLMQTLKALISQFIDNLSAFLITMGL